MKNALHIKSSLIIFTILDPYVFNFLGLLVHYFYSVNKLIVPSLGIGLTSRSSSLSGCRNDNVVVINIHRMMVIQFPERFAVLDCYKH